MFGILILALKILIIGDIIGKPGRNILLENLEKIKKDKKIDFVIVNGENSAGDGRTNNQGKAERGLVYPQHAAAQLVSHGGGGQRL